MYSMTDVVISLVLGMVIGTCVGVMIMALFSAGRKGK